MHNVYLKNGLSAYEARVEEVIYGWLVPPREKLAELVLFAAIRHNVDLSAPLTFVDHDEGFD